MSSETAGRICGGTGAKVTRLTLGGLHSRHGGQALTFRDVGRESQKSAEGSTADAAAGGPNEQPWTDAGVSMTKVVAGSRTERSERLRDVATGSRQRPRNERQTVTAAEEVIGPHPSQLMEEVLQRKNLQGALNRMAEVKQTFDVMDQWIRHRLRKILWQQWKTPRTRAKKLQSFGTWPEKAKRATSNGRGPWWNAAAPHMHAAITNERLATWGLLSLLEMQRKVIRAA